MAELVDAKVCDYRENVVLSFPIWNFSNSCRFDPCYHHNGERCFSLYFRIPSIKTLK